MSFNILSGPSSCKRSLIVHFKLLQKSKAPLLALQSVNSSRVSKGCRSYGSDQVFPPYFPKIHFRGSHTVGTVKAFMLTHRELSVSKHRNPR